VVLAGGLNEVVLPEEAMERWGGLYRENGGEIIQWGGGCEVSSKAVSDPLPVSENPSHRHPERLLAVEVAV